MTGVPPHWSNAVRYPPDGTTFDGLVGAACRAYPDRPAVIDGDSVLTFAELDRRSDALARWLAGAGVRKGTRVLILGRRTPDTAVALLGVLKSGATGVPVDDSGRRSFVDHCVDAVKPEAILVDQASPAAALPSGRHVLRPPADLPDPGTGAPRSAHTGSDPAFVMFTSGSIGSPLPVCLPHRAAIQYAPPDPEMADVAGEGRNPLRPGDRVLMAAPLGNRLIRELLTPWIAGATVVLAPPGREADAAHLAALIEREEVTVFNTVPPLLSAILDVSDPGQLKSLRLVDSQGEPLPEQTQRELRDQIGCRARNRYGATEFGPGLSHEFSPSPWGGRPVLGRPAAGVAVRLLDGDRPVAVGEEGEIHIGSPGMFTGYYGMPAQTAARFVPDPVDPAAGPLFRTGDIGVYRPDGVLEYVGRRDDRVTVRGHKVFLSHLERRLGELDGVRDSAVVALHGDLGGPRLVAFVVPEAPLDPGQLRRQATAVLPDAGLLSGMLLVSELPVTASGKKDRSALRDRATREWRPDVGGAAGTVAQTVAAVIGRPVSVHDNPLDVGVNSIDAVRIAARLSALFAVTLEPASVLEAADLADLAACLDAGHDKGGGGGGHPAVAADAAADTAGL